MHPLNNCTNKSRTAQTKKMYKSTFVGALETSAPPKQLHPSSKNTKKGCSCINCTP